MTDKKTKALKLAQEALDVLLTEPIAHKAADRAEYLLLQAAPAIREALAEQPAQGETKMNERMLEIAFKSLFINKRVRDGSYFIDDPELMAKLEKFAELIVLECAYVCERFGESGDGYTCSAEILENFGVEE